MPNVAKRHARRRFAALDWVRGLALCGGAVLVSVATSGSVNLQSDLPDPRIATPAAAEREPRDHRLLRAAFAVGRTAVVRPSRAGTRGVADVEPPRWLERCEAGAKHSAAAHHTNGAVPRADLCQLPGTDHLLHGDAARGWWQLNRAFVRRFKTAICITDSYRSYEAQVWLYANKPGLAAVPGTSNHGWGVAVDLCGGIESYGSPRHQWLRRNGVRYGWVNPRWAQQDGTLPEPWHWEYVGS